MTRYELEKQRRKKKENAYRNAGLEKQNESSVVFFNLLNIRNSWN